MNVKKIAAGAALAGALTLGAVGPANAQASPEIAQMSTDIVAMTDVGRTKVMPVAILTIAFGAGALLIKRFVYA